MTDTDLLQLVSGRRRRAPGTSSRRASSSEVSPQSPQTLPWLVAKVRRHKRAHTHKHKRGVSGVKKSTNCSLLRGGKVLYHGLSRTSLSHIIRNSRHSLCPAHDDVDLDRVLRSKKKLRGGGRENAPARRRLRFGQQAVSLRSASSRASSPLPIVDDGRPESNILRATSKPSPVLQPPWRATPLGFTPTSALRFDAETSGSVHATRELPAESSSVRRRSRRRRSPRTKPRELAASCSSLPSRRRSHRSTCPLGRRCFRRKITSEICARRSIPETMPPS